MRQPSRLIRHLTPALLLVTVVIFLFRLSIFGRYRFVGNSDRWNHYLSLAEFHAQNIEAGRISAWSYNIFMGFDTLAQPFSFVSPLFGLPPLIGSRDMIRVLGLVSPLILLLTLLLAYFVIDAIIKDRLASVAGALVYGLSTWSLLKLTQNDNSYLTILLSPTLFYVVHTTTVKNLHRRILGLGSLFTVAFYWSFLNYFSYVVILLIAYSAYLAVTASRAPAAAVAGGLTLGALLAAPRLLILAETLRDSIRPGGLLFEVVTPVLFLRYLNANIFGRSYREAALVQPGINLSEGNLLHASIFASLFLVAILFGFRFHGTGNRTLPKGTERFLRAFVACVLFVIHIPALYALFSYLFANVSFLHTRFGMAAMAPIAILTAAHLKRNAPQWGNRRRAAALVAGSIVGVTAACFPLDSVAAWSLRLDTFPPSHFIAVGMSGFFVLVPELLRLILLAVILAVMLGAQSLRYLSPDTVRMLLALTIAGESVVTASHYLGGRHTWSYTVPFESQDPLLALPSHFLPPTPEQRQVLAALVEKERYRSVLLCRLPIECSTGLAMTWDLRLVDGYLSGVPKRYAALPWPKSSVGTRSIRFWEVEGSTSTTGAWRLLSFLNAKFAILVSESLLINERFDPRQLLIEENPSPYIYPRAYFAARTLATTTKDAVHALGAALGCSQGDASDCPTLLDAKLPLDYVEGPVLGDFDDSGDVRWRIDGDSMVFEFPPSPLKRFLVVNEAFNRRWQASSGGRRLDVYPTNLVMLGVVVPEGETNIKMTFRSLLRDMFHYLVVLVPSLVFLVYRFRRHLGRLAATMG